MTIHDAGNLHETEEDTALGGTWRNCRAASWSAIIDSAGGNAQALVWPDEGAWSPTGKTFTFNEAHSDFQPLLIDKVSATMLLALHHALQDPKNKQKVEEWVAKGRGHFGKIWEMTNEKVRIVGFGPGGAAIQTG